MKKILLLLSVYTIFSFFACGNSAQNQANNRKNDKKEQRNGENNAEGNHRSDNGVPQKVYEVLKYVRQNNEAMPGYVGGRNFQNREKRLPITDDKDKKIRYQEWDVNPKQQGRNRGTERLITSKEKAYFTDDHYKTFTEINEKY
jgi:ribonuclease T1